MSGFRSVFAWALVLMASFPSAVVTAPVDETSASNSLDTRAVAWEARHEMDFQGIRDTNWDMYHKGYRMSHITSSLRGKTPTYAAIWEKPANPDAFMKLIDKEADYQGIHNYYVQLGYRPRVIAPMTMSDGTTWVNSVWDKSPSSGWVARFSMTPAEYQTAFNENTRLGYRLVRVNGYISGRAGGQERYTAIWEKFTSVVPGFAHHGMSAAQYDQYISQYKNQGFRPVWVAVHVFNNVPYFSAIWEKSAGAWQARYDLTSSTYQYENGIWVKQGYRLKVVSMYTISGQDRYAAIFLVE